MFLMTVPCCFCITINGYIVWSCGQCITVVAPIWIEHPCLAEPKWGKNFTQGTKGVLEGASRGWQHHADPSKRWGKEPPPGSAHCSALNLREGSPVVANLSIFWEWKPSLISTLIIKRKQSKLGYRIKVHMFWKQSMIFFQEFYLWVELNDTRKKEKYRTLFCPKVCNHTIHDYISYCNTKN